jgi:adenylate cyclase
MIKQCATLLLCLYLSQVCVWAQQDRSYKIPYITKDSLAVGSKGVSFSNNWLFNNIDDSLWSKPLPFDTALKQLRSFENDESIDSLFFKAGFTGIGWFQQEFMIDSSLIMVPLSLVIEGSGAFDVYIDGEMVHQFGTKDATGAQYYLNPRLFPVIFMSAESGKHLIAVRYENLQTGALNNDQGVGFYLSLRLADDAITLYRNKALLSGTIICGIAIAFATLAFIHFMIFLFYKQAISNLYFGLFNLSMVILFASFFVLTLAQSLKVQGFALQTLDIYPALSAFSLSSFVNNLFAKRKWSFWVIIGMDILYLLSLLVGFDPENHLAVVLIVFSSLEAIVLILIAIRHKIAGSRILGSGILFFFTFLLVMFALAFFSGPTIMIDGNSSLGRLLVVVIMLALFSIPFSISGYLAWSFATTNKSLSAQLEQVALLSQKTLEQEREKQVLLHNRKEELELEVEARTHEILLEKGKSDALLLNILPAEVAQELKDKGEAQAQQFDNVSVLFTDFVDFTKISAQLTPQELVAKLHTYFKAFDEIIERNGLEKIKTIGDAYLAVSGIPLSTDQHATRAVKASLEIIAFINEQTDNPFSVRVGIHSGSLVAGIVGVKKFAYDIWGDTVNTAARMESNSLPGKVNISNTTYLLVQQQYHCTHRGKIETKGKGEMDMYFVESAT